MSRFVSNKTRKIYLLNQDGSQSEDWVEVREKFGFRHVIESSEPGDDGLKSGLHLLEKAIIAWNLKDENGNDVPVSKEAILDLDMDTVSVLIKEVNKSVRFGDEKKNESLNPSSDSQ